MKILWITPRWPEPAEDGARIATLQLLRHLQNERDFEITLLGVLPEGDDAPSVRGVELQATRVIRRPALRSHPALRLLSRPWVPITFVSFVTPAVKRQLRLAVSEPGWDCIVFDGMHAAIPFMSGGKLTGFSFPPEVRARLIYRAHNVEFTIWERAAALARFPKSFVIDFQAKLVREFESSLSRRCDWILPVSEHDGGLFSGLAPGTRQEVIRIGQDFPGHCPIRTPLAADAIVLGFLGRLDWMPNRQGLSWFLDHVWPQISGLKLKIAGSGDDSWLSRYKDRPGVELVGKVASVDLYYSQIDALVVPLFIGSGTRVKVIESSRFAVPCISTRLGVEGCPLEPGKSYVQAEAVEEWVGALNSLTRGDARALGASAFARMKKSYDARSIAMKAATILRS